MPVKKLVAYFVVLISGMILGAFLWSGEHRYGQTPIKVPICFVMQNKELFDHRRILTTGHLVVDLHGEFFWDDECHGLLTFTSSASSVDSWRPLESRLIADFSKQGRADIPVTFIGTIQSQSKMNTLALRTSEFFRLRYKGAKDVTIDRIIAFGPEAESN